MLARALEGIPVYPDPNVLVGFERADDGGVYRLDDETALVQSVDFLTPVVDDPFVYGQIAAVNALSDIYAMGGLPRLALSIVGFPDQDLEEALLHEILRGGAEKMKEVGVPVLGGHSVRDAELKFGYCVTGLVHPERVYTNAGAREGDALILTKPLGSGIIATGIKFGKTPQRVAERATEWMLTLNLGAMQQIQQFSVSAVTDVTGFGLLGHAYELARASDKILSLRAESIPVMEGVESLARQGMLPGGIESNRRFVNDGVCWGEVSVVLRQILLDPQTSGGLLISLPQGEAEGLGRVLEEIGLKGGQIGWVGARPADRAGTFIDLTD